MKRLSVLAAVALLLCSCSKDNCQSIQEPIEIALTAPESSIAVQSNNITFDLLSRTSESVQRNVMISPYSLAACLSMTANGAAGETRREMLSAMGYGGHSIEDVNSYFKKVTSAILKADPSTKLSIANSIWYRNSIKVKTTFTDAAKTWFHADVRALDFDAQSAPLAINKWVSDKTNGLITNVIDNIDPSSIMFLINAVYFKSVWSDGYQFKTASTASADFIAPGAAYSQVSMMSNTFTYKCLKNSDVMIVKIPYGNKSFQFTAYMPLNGDTPSAFAKKLSNQEYYNSLKSSLNTKNITLKLPKFKFRFNIELTQTLKSMGISKAFDPYSADFDNAFENVDDAYISFVKQFNYIEVEEKGTEAASVTLTGIETTALPVQPELFIFNKPFLFTISENSTGIVLFAGSVINPKLSN